MMVTVPDPSATSVGTKAARSANACARERPTLDPHDATDDAFRRGRVDPACDRVGSGMLRHGERDYRVP